MAEDLQKKLKDKLQGGQGISSSDVADFERPAEVAEPIKGDLKAKVPVEADEDDMIKEAAKGDAGPRINKAAERVIPAGNPLYDPSALPDEVTITEEERNKFLEAIVTGERLELPFSLFNGKIKGKMRSRSQKESTAIVTQLNHEATGEKLETALEYSTRLRNMMLAAQVAELNGRQFSVLMGPLHSVSQGKDENGKEIIDPPGWLGQIEYWEETHEGLAGALYHELQIFERKYWTMVKNAADQDFWVPAESTSE